MIIKNLIKSKAYNQNILISYFLLKSCYDHNYFHVKLTK